MTLKVYPEYRGRWRMNNLYKYCPKCEWKRHAQSFYCWNNFELKMIANQTINKPAPSSEFLSSSIPSWQILTAHAQPFRGARDLAFCLKVPLDSLLVWASSGGSGGIARMRRLAWTFAAYIGDKYQIRLTRPKLFWLTLGPHRCWMMYCNTFVAKLRFIQIIKIQTDFGDHQNIHN